MPAEYQQQSHLKGPTKNQYFDGFLKWSWTECQLALLEMGELLHKMAAQ